MGVVSIMHFHFQKGFLVVATQRSSVIPVYNAQLQDAKTLAKFASVSKYEKLRDDIGAMQKPKSPPASAGDGGKRIRPFLVVCGLTRFSAGDLR